MNLNNIIVAGSFFTTLSADFLTLCARNLRKRSAHYYFCWKDY